MDISSLLVFLLIGAIAGWLAGQLMKGRGFGLVGNILVGIVGAVIGGFVFGLLGLSATGLIGSIAPIGIRDVAEVGSVTAAVEARRSARTRDSSRFYNFAGWTVATGLWVIIIYFAAWLSVRQ